MAEKLDEDLLRGIAAAPPGPVPDDWQRLLPPDLAPAARAEAAARIAALRAERPAEPPLAARLEALRSRLRTLGVDGLILQRTDSFNSEYLPAAAERMAWLTGFTGSAGVTVVLAERAAVFVDGRYTVQVRQQVDATRFEICHLIDQPPASWLERHLPEGAALGYDPGLTKKAERERLTAAVAARGGRLVALPENPVDSIWTTRPAAPLAPVARHDERYAGEPAASKRQRIAGLLAERGVAALALTAPDSIAWLLNLRGGDIPYNPLTLAYALLARDGTCRLFVDPRKLPPDLVLDNAVAVEPETAFMTALDGLGGCRVLVDPSATHVAFLDRLAAAGAVLVEGDDPCVLAKARKNPVELEGARAAQRRDGAAVARFLAWLDAQPHDGSLTELAAAARLEALRAEDPLARGPSFATIAAHGPNAAIPHYHPSPTSDRPLTAGTVFLIDSGGQYLDATTDITRTVPLGACPAEVAARFTLVLKGHIALATALFPAGTTGAQLDTLARTALWRHGLDFDHGTGHGVGSYLCVHEGPARIAKAGTRTALEPGMILSNEPGYYKADAYGIRIENLIAVSEAPAPADAERPLLAFETLTLCPIDRRLIDPALLTADERAWLDAYHARVRRELAPLLDAATLAWLEPMCAPL